MQLSELPKTYSEAKAAGYIYYFTGKPCAAGHVSKSTTNGRTCFECKKARLKEWRIANPEKNKKLTDKHNRTAKRKAKKAEWKAKNRERLNQQNREWHHKNPEKAAEKLKRWKSKNVEVCRTYCRNRQARLKNAEGTHTKADIDALYVQQHGMCVVCRVSLLDGYHVDHIVAISKGGKNSPDNLQLLCAPCNQSKNDKDFDEWLQQRVIAI